MKKVYMIGNTHFDPVWLWKWDEAMSSITATFRSALSRMEEYPEFKYSFATPPVFEWIRKTDPELFEQIKRRVEEGRWELAEGWWLQPDCYTPSGESLVRQGLYGQRYLMQTFGRYSDTVFNIDSFGHPPTLPQILKKSRIRNYVFCRPEGRHIKLDAPLFNWVSRDGSEVLAYRDDAPYNNDTKAAIAEAEKLPYDSLLVYGVTDHGGAPTIRSIEEIKSSESADFATVGEFFENISTSYSHSGELVTGDFGPYVNGTEIKSMNRKAEYAVLNAESASVMAGSYDREKITECWRDVLFNQFHDILGGASIKEAYFDARNMHGRAIATANEIKHFSLLSLANKIKMPGKNPDNIWNIVVFNLNAREYDGYIEAEVQWVHEFPWYDKGILLEDSDGNRYDCQIIRERSVIPRFRSRFLFKASIPSMGYKAFKLIKTNEDIPTYKLENMRELQTNRYKISLSDEGAITSVYDKLLDKRITKSLFRPACFVDDGDTWAFNVKSLGEELEPPRLKDIKAVEVGSMRTVIKATYSFRSSLISLYYTVYRDEKYIDIRYRVNWNEKHIALKLISDIGDNAHEAAVPYGSVYRSESSAELPVGEWLKTDAFTLAFDRPFAYNLVDKRLGLALLRSPIYGDLRISEIDLETDYDIMEQGITEGNIRVSFDENCDAVRLGRELNNPPTVLCEACHDGILPSVGSYLSLESLGSHITALKKAEDSGATVIRGVQCSGVAETVKIKYLGKSYSLELSPCEIFTAVIDAGGIRKTDMLEG